MKNVSTKTRVAFKRVYDPPSKNDGFRVLVDRLWPRGLKKEKASIDLWYKDIAPSSDLREWFGHEPAKWAEFKRRYFKELYNCHQQVVELVEKTKGRNLTLLFAAKEEIYNNAAALAEYIEKNVKK